ncbi:DUF4199 domain-containing protein [Mucilaginibacter mali]|uniref:DUF4199 domain-containing protein n=1 Tax=Mucilaginibacter mali TaxID=2740462 RepID=A0A7D4UPG7_9SPHI|nr:DUF4199 domain-containing protein [Mucilaginibacter mali]QKJ30480.1 DUF4199 domain-containing protein [Mucilaginibacter mali]
MKKSVLRYGGYAALAELIFFVLTWLFIWAFAPSHKVQGYIGWVDLLCPLVFVYLGIRYYRDKVNNGNISFLQALKVGVLIVLVPALAYALIETIFALYIEPDFYDKLAKYDIEQYRKTLSAAQLDAKIKAINKQLVMNKNPFFNFTAMVLVITSLGVIVTIVSSLLLKQQNKEQSA